jgi:hypothetical protein
LKHWFYQPDIEALEVTLAVAASHFQPSEPTWLFVVGPPATGKTSVNIQVLRTSPSAYLIGDLTPQTFLSGKRKKDGAPEPSLLQRLGNGILLMKDFTTMISKRPDDRAMIVSQLREIYDGTFTKDTGESGRLYWTGKMTVIAACTPAIEREWAILRDLGERFMTIRWDRENGMTSARRTLEQRMHESDIAARSSALGKQIMEALPKTRGTTSAHVRDRIVHLAEIVALSRNRVIRDSHGSREIIDIPPAEGPNRIAKALMSVAVNYGAVLHRDPLDEDVRLAVRMAMNSIPHTRYKLISNIPVDTSIDRSHLAKASKLPESSLSWQLDELEALSLLKRIAVGNTTSYEYSDELRDLWKGAFPSSI